MKKNADEAFFRQILESAYEQFHRTHYRQKDPVDLVHSYADPKDQEIAAFLAALIAYGNVTAILGSLRKLLSALSPSPYRCVRDGEFPPGLRAFCHRFTTGADLEILLYWLGCALRSHGSLEAFFAPSPLAKSQPMKALLSDFIQRFTGQALPRPLQELHQRRARNIKYLLSDPLRGSACKRLNMFLRWMVREKDGIDLGLWKSVTPAQLVLPVDTHILQVLQALRWTRSKQANWRVAEAATERLKGYAPADPARYDFALCHLSMEGTDIRRYLIKK